VTQTRTKSQTTTKKQTHTKSQTNDRKGTTMVTTKNPPSAATRPEATVSAASSAAVDDAPRPLSAAELTTTATADTVTVEPQLGPPGSPNANPATDGLTAWVTNAHVSALWANNSARNGWAYVTGVGWKKLGGTTDFAHLGLVQLARLARDTNAGVNYRDEADGLIHEMYVW
jgi:hypothetical protein